MSSEEKSKKDEQLDQYTAEHKDEKLTTNQGVPVSHTDDSLKAGERGPTLMEDFHFREKMTHFDHERIPERVVHARGFGAHGFFEVYESMADYTMAQFLQDPSVRTPVFVRFSTVVGSRGSGDLARDVRGFATKFYTQEGNYDLVGNNIPIFFIQDAIKFPDLVHSIKPEPHNEVPQASAAHDTFWDFVSSTPETANMIMWLLSDRGIPRSFRMMEGFGVNTFRLVNAEGKARFVKFHWKPKLGTHSMVWDEAQKINGKDPDFHRRDLWNAIEMGNYPEWEFGVQMIEEEDEFKFDFDILDPTKIWPEEQVPVKIIGRMVLNRNTDNFFAETEQVAFHPGNLVPGIDVSNDPLLQGRLFSYLDTQLIRLGGPNFHELPINRPLAPIHNNQRDGYNRITIDRGEQGSHDWVAYSPNSLWNNTPGPDQERGYVHYQEKVEGHKIRARSESFKDFYSQAKLFWNSMSKYEKARIIAAFHFEVGKVKDMGVKMRVVEVFNNVDGELAKQIALGVGVDPPEMPGGSDVTATSPAVSIETTNYSAETRKVAILADDGCDYMALNKMMEALKEAGVMSEVVSKRQGMLKSQDGQEIKIDMSYPTTASVLYDALYIPGGMECVQALMKQADALQFVKEMYVHYKAIAASGQGLDLLQEADIKFEEGTGQEGQVSNRLGVVTMRNGDDMQSFCDTFVEAIAKHRHWGRMDEDMWQASERPYTLDL